ncbi:hypothetical protein [Pseudomonas atacamensis]|uniref:hypothetical protein n=1 Tax=Pseudomonas atacamensis TaxID=2565368 RepID=UPI0011B5018F
MTNFTTPSLAGKISPGCSQLPNLDSSQLQNFIKPLADIFDKSNAFLNEANRDTSVTSIRVSGTAP